jgi:putative transcriptional regulator
MMSDILKAAHELAQDLHAVDAMDSITMRMMDELCLPPKRTFSAADIKRLRTQTHMSQPVFALLLGVGANTVAQWEQGHKRPSGPSARLLDVLDRKGIEALA